MLPAEVRDALHTLTSALATGPEFAAEALSARWLGLRSELSADVRAAADRLAEALPSLVQSPDGVDALGALLPEAAGEVLLRWCASRVGRREAPLGKLLALAAAEPRLRERAIAVARDRVVEGPFFDALACAPLLGDGSQLVLPENAQARARLEILVWEAGAAAVEIPHLGAWLWGSADTFETMIRGPARGTLRGRVLAARCLEVSVRGMPA